jgi:hypothetical protein
MSRKRIDTSRACGIPIRGFTRPVRLQEHRRIDRRQGSNTLGDDECHDLVARSHRAVCHCWHRLLPLGGRLQRLLHESNKVGYNGGVGLRAGLFGLSAFVEARFHFIPGASAPTTGGLTTNTQFIPLSVGVTF